MELPLVGFNSFRLIVMQKNKNMKHIKVLLVLIGICTSYFGFAKEHYVKLTIEGVEHEFICKESQSIFEAAKVYGLKFEYEYDAGATNVSMAKLIYGVVDISRQSYLDKKQIEEKLILLTEVYPRSDCEIIVVSKLKETKLKYCVFHGPYTSYLASGSGIFKDINIYEDNLLGYRIIAVAGQVSYHLFHETNDVLPKYLTGVIRTLGVKHTVTKAQLPMFKSDYIDVGYYFSMPSKVSIYD